MSRANSNSALAAQRSGDGQPQAAVSELRVIRGSANHTLQFYETDEYLLNWVAEFISAGLRTGNPAVAIVDPEHRAHLCGLFQSEVANGNCRLLDARETLASFMRQGMPDRDHFRIVLAEILQLFQPAPPLGKLRVFGEMVDMLWRDGRKDAAVRLEVMWDEAVSEHSFALLCSCFIGHFDADSDTDRFSRVCQHHVACCPLSGFQAKPYHRLKRGRLRDCSIAPEHWKRN